MAALLVTPESSSFGTDLDSDEGVHVAYDAVLSQIGDMGLYQKRLLLLAIIASAFFGLHLLSTIFTMGAPEFRCAVPGLQNDTFRIQNEAHATMVKASIPYDSEIEGYSQCYRYGSTPNRSDWLLGWTEQTWINVTTGLERETCSRWVYSTDVFTSSIFVELDLVCDRTIYISHTNMMSMAGFMVGSIVGGAVSDMFGRKKTFLFFFWLHLVAAACAVLVTTVWAWLITRLLVSSAGMAFYMSIYVLSAEVVGPKKRAEAGMCNVCGWVGGMLLLLLLAYIFRDWKTLQIVSTCPMIVIAITYIWLLTESPRWLVSKGRYTEAEVILTEMAKVNKKELPEKCLLSDLNNVEAKVADDKKDSIQEDHATHLGGQQNVLLLLKSPILTIRLAILSFCWVVVSMVYYGVTLNLGSIIEGDIYLNFLILAVLELLSYCLYVLALRRVGRKRLFLACILCGGVACLATIVPLVVGGDVAVINMVLSNLGKFGISAAFAVMWLYTPELLPTPVRQSGVGFCSFVGRLGGIISPYIAMLPTVVGGPVGKALPLVVFGAAAVTAGVLSLVLPETANRKLPDTIEEAENIKTESGDEQSCSCCFGSRRRAL